MSDARDRVLAAVRAALRRDGAPAPAPSAADGREIREGRVASRPDASDAAGLTARFARELEALAADLVTAPRASAATAELAEHLRRVGVEHIAAETSDARTEAVAAELEAAGFTVTRLPELAPGARRDCLATVDTVLTGADHALAATGTLVCTPMTLPDRIAAGLPRRHVAVVPAERLEPDLPSLLERRPEIATQPLLFISGPSRTADVEKTLVLGAHGPAGLTVVLLGASRGE